MGAFRSIRSAAWPLVVLAMLAAAAGCEVDKSENPLSPSVAGPIAGVEITAPRPLEPAQGSKIKQTTQPIRLMVENASTSGVRPLSYTFELANDSGFQTKLFARSGVTPGADGKTAVQLDRLELGRAYFWRARAEDGANSGPYSTVQFEVLPQPQLDPPALISPVNNEKVSSLRPTLLMGAPSRNAAVGALIYDLQVSLDVAFSQVISIGRFNEQGGQSTFTPTNELPASRQYYWRVRAGDGETTSAWAATQTFTTPAGAPAPSPGPSPSPSPGGGSCASNNGPAIVSCIAAKYPDRLVGGISLAQRQENMAFLRDRIIDAGKCGGLNLGLNLKRGGPDISIDFLAWRRNDGDMGVDIGLDYDNTSVPLRLYWGEAGLGATFQATGAPNCSQ
jgi:hypothetical protein